MSGTALYLDSDNDGSFDPEKDRQLGQKVALESDNASVSFSFGETLSPDSQVGFFLVVDLASRVKSSRAWVVVTVSVAGMEVPDLF